MENIKANQEIRKFIKDNNLKHYEVANMLGIGETTLVRKLRIELPEEEKENILNIISTNLKK